MPLKVNIAGYNIDKSLIDSLNDPSATPEVISAAYARISRSEKSITELREEALSEIPKARKSNESIIFEMGHSSIAEHAVFNIDIIGISRLLAETVESIRLASYTEKSQRYVTFEDDFVIPAELANQTQSLQNRFVSMHKKLFEEYKLCYDLLLKYYAKKRLKLTPRELEGKAKEDARYILPLATKTQLGMTINARSLENLLRKLKRTPLAEALELYNALIKPIQEISPSLIRYTDDPGFEAKVIFPKTHQKWSMLDDDEFVRLVSFEGDPDDRLLACIYYDQTVCDFAFCVEVVNSLSFDEKQELWNQVFNGIKPWHKLPRTFEMVDFTFELCMSESCWAQFKRHRIGSVIKKKEAVTEPFIPEAIDEIGRYDVWYSLNNKFLDFGDEKFSTNPAIHSYFKMNLDPVQILVKMNLRELYHFVRLRSDEHAQWEIRNLSDLISDHLRVVAPNASRYLAGKSQMMQKD